MLGMKCSKGPGRVCERHKLLYSQTVPKLEGPGNKYLASEEAVLEGFGKMDRN